jgi:hypothetical protein
MIIEMEFSRGFRHEALLSVSRKNGVTRYHAQLAETGFISHFDFHADYSGETIEEAIEKIAKAIDAAIDIMHGV